MRVIGLMDAYPFYTRYMTTEEIKDCHFDTRERYIVYTDWETLLEDDALFGVPENELNELRSYMEKYKLPARIKTQEQTQTQTELNFEDAFDSEE